MSQQNDINSPNSSLPEVQPSSIQHPEDEFPNNNATNASQITQTEVVECFPTKKGGFKRLYELKNTEEVDGLTLAGEAYCVRYNITVKPGCIVKLKTENALFEVIAIFERDNCSKFVVLVPQNGDLISIKPLNSVVEVIGCSPDERLPELVKYLNEWKLHRDERSARQQKHINDLNERPKRNKQQITVNCVQEENEQLKKQIASLKSKLHVKKPKLTHSSSSKIASNESSDASQLQSATLPSSSSPSDPLSATLQLLLSNSSSQSISNAFNLNPFLLSAFLSQMFSQNQQIQAHQQEATNLSTQQNQQLLQVLLAFMVGKK